MSTLERITRTCSTCRQLIVQLLEAREELDRASPGEPGAAGLRDKVAKLQAATQAEFLKAMDALADHHR